MPRPQKRRGIRFLRYSFTLRPHKSHFVRISFALGAKSPAIRAAITHSGRGFFVMKMTVWAGLFAVGRLCVLWHGAMVRGAGYAGHNDLVQATTAVNIARIKSVLKLTSAQEAHWAPVEAALRDLARRQSQTEST